MEGTAGQGKLALAPSFPVMTIYAHETLPAGIIAQLDGSRLFVDPTAPPEQQLNAIADAVHTLRTGRASSGA
jgi:hypothetical protein